MVRDVSSSGVRAAGTLATQGADWTRVLRKSRVTLAHYDARGVEGKKERNSPDDGFNGRVPVHLPSGLCGGQRMTGREGKRRSSERKWADAG